MQQILLRRFKNSKIFVNKQKNVRKESPIYAKDTKFQSDLINTMWDIASKICNMATQTI